MEPTVTTPPAYSLVRYGPGQAADIRQLLLDVHADTYADERDEFHDTDRFAWFVDHWSALPGFDVVVGYDGGEPAGYAYGAPAVHGREWWRDYLDPAPAATETFSLSELMVRPRWQGTGLSVLLHDELVGRRPEPLTVLLVDTEHPRVQALYESWGYTKAGERQPFADSPVYAVMVRGLP
ncbi:GNAT family N-acetyltransferase [Streptomyces sp. NPDC101490]|uniref:GNAT family N-acetyltransferase n=1 Tax=Streptomyces sp. NPDC101490 TaxID=3366143 RepID=UPI0038239F39